MNDYNEFTDIMMFSLLKKDFSDHEEGMQEIARFLSVTMTDVVIKGNELLERYKAILLKLKA